MSKAYETALAFLPHAIISGEIALLWWLLIEPAVWKIPLILLMPYLVPLVLSRVTHAIWPLEEGAHYYDPKVANAWIMSFRIQAILGAFPQLERTLIVLGLYSPWLRLWGSKIGKRVLWTSHTMILDRAGIEIGDDVFFGHLCMLTPHVTDKRKGTFFLYFKKIRIGHRVFIGGACRMGPGVRVDDDVKIPAGTDIFIGKRITQESFKK